ncbi:WhiB family transcriptional regulator [Streptomyces sp. NPDC058220]|uniref:WhiB family transcriptional regulator n=1 Tax=Streptomyces sp. NPDC058220 TaxID=3346387 RepID=UPI0036ECC862
MTTAWPQRAACLGLDELFLPEVAVPSKTRAAKAVCHTCPVEAACLADALTTETAGASAFARGYVRGGMSPSARAHLPRVDRDRLIAAGTTEAARV